MSEAAFTLPKLEHAVEPNNFPLLFQLILRHLLNRTLSHDHLLEQSLTELVLLLAWPVHQLLVILVEIHTHFKGQPVLLCNLLEYLEVDEELGHETRLVV